MKTIKILGTGCANCKTTQEIVQEVVNELQLDVTIEKVEDIQEIMAFDVMSTPAVVIDGKVAMVGKVPTKEEMKQILVTICTSEAVDGACCGGNTSCC